MRLGVDPKHSDQMVRGAIVLPNGTGKKEKILVFAKGEKEKEAVDNGADYVGAEDIIEKIIFTEELIVGNPACTELKEIVDEAKILYSKGEIEATKQKLDDVIEACMRAITQPATDKKSNRLEENIFAYISIASMLAFGVGIVYYQFRKIKLKMTVAKEIKQHSIQ